MQSHESDKCPEAGAGDGGRDAERRTLQAALGMAIALLTHAANRSMHVENGSTVDLSAGLRGGGGLSA